MATAWSEEEVYAVRELGALLLGEGRADLARVLFAGLAEVDPNDAWSRVALGHALRELRLYDDAASAIDDALRVDPQSIDAAVSLGEVHLLKGKAAEARGCATMADFLAQRADLAPALRLRLERLKRAAAPDASRG